MQHVESENIYRLKNIGLPAIRVLNDLATATRLSPEFLKIISGRSKRFYKIYEVEKNQVVDGSFHSHRESSKLSKVGF